MWTLGYWGDLLVLGDMGDSGVLYIFRDLENLKYLWVAGYFVDFEQISRSGELLEIFDMFEKW